MRLIWTKSTLPLSVMIRAITGEDCSHFAFVFESKIGGEMFESNFLGTHIKFYKNAQKHFTLVHQVKLDVPVETEDLIWSRVVDQYDDKPYDFGGMLYIGWRTILKRLFNIPKPLINKWQSTDKFYCDEIYDALKGIPGLPELDVSGGMDTPYEVYLKIAGK